MSLFGMGGPMTQSPQQGQGRQQLQYPQQLARQSAPARMTQQQALAAIKQDPNGIVRRCYRDAPDGVTDPEQLTKYLLNSGQVPGPLANFARQMMAKMGLQ